ncbi:MAG TPA: hypothetical protein VFJ58_15000 [Armatimonadota bacterium]|nr:hypothetical protein [Armatimonadota bacterium]
MEQQSDLTGQSWATSAQYLNGSEIIRRNNEFHHWDYRGTAGVITDGAGNVLSNNVYDQFKVGRYSSGTAATPARWTGAQVADEGLLYTGPRGYLDPNWGESPVRKRRPPKWATLYGHQPDGADGAGRVRDWWLRRMPGEMDLHRSRRRRLPCWFSSMFGGVRMGHNRRA